jgi:hypothetical protein
MLMSGAMSRTRRNAYPPLLFQHTKCIRYHYEGITRRGHRKRDSKTVGPPRREIRRAYHELTRVPFTRMDRRHTDHGAAQPVDRPTFSRISPSIDHCIADTMEKRG